MKTPVFFLIIACSVITIKSVTSQERPPQVQKVKKLFNDCKNKVGASDADIERLKIERKLPETHTGLCMLECVLDTSRIMQDGKFNKDGMVQALKPLLTIMGKSKRFRSLPINNNGARITQETVENWASSCDEELRNTQVDDKCQNAKLLIECLVKSAKGHGLQIQA